MKILARPRRLVLAALALALGVEPALATWSIVVVDTRTGEVGIAGATCLPGNLEKLIPVVLPGVGVACAQSNVDSTCVNRQLILAGFQSGLTPAEILDALAATDPQHDGRQYGIVDLWNHPVTFTGIGAGFAKPSCAGIAGDLRYAIQGNVLAGDEVVIAAQAAFLTTTGDLSQRMLAAMKAARTYGGDGRCSCSNTHPTQCGSPPPDFDKSAHSGFLLVARIGDSVGVCDATFGCATGNYYLDLNINGKLNKPDPVRQLDEQYMIWRASMPGIVDQVHSKVALSKPGLVADGSDALAVTLELGDLDRARILHGGHAIRVEPLNTPAPVTTVGAVVDHGDGSYHFLVQAGTLPGQDTWRVIVTEAGKDVVLQPDVAVTVAAPRRR